MIDTLPEALAIRLRQQAILSEFGLKAMRATELLPLLQQATDLCAEGIGAEFCKALEFHAESDLLIVCAGAGWEDEVVGKATFGADLASPAGFALKTGRPVISNHLANETRFRTPELLASHGIRRAINVLISNRDGHYGVLEVDDRREGAFEEADIAFMQGFANLIGGAIERLRGEARLKAALERQELLTREMSHRVKNSLAVVAGLLALQGKASGEEGVARALADARTRVEAIAQVHDQVWRQPDVTVIELSDFLEALCAGIQGSAGRNRVVCRAEPMRLSADHAVPLGLFVNELVTNALKYAYPDREGEIRVEAKRIEDGRLLVSVADDGVGLPENFDPAAERRSLGMRVVVNLARQLDGTLSVEPGTGARFVLTMTPRV